MRDGAKEILWAIAGLLGSIASVFLIVLGCVEMFRGRLDEATLSFVLVILFQTAALRGAGKERTR